MVGYEPRPGLAADAWLAFTLDDLDKDAVLAGTGRDPRLQPTGSGRNHAALRDRRGPYRATPVEPDASPAHRPPWLVTKLPDDVPAEAPTPQSITADDVCLWFMGTNTGLVPGSVLLFDDDAMQRKLGRQVALVEPLPKGSASPDAPILEDQTRVVLQAPRPFPAHDGAARDADHQDPPDPGRQTRALHVEPGGSLAESVGVVRGRLGRPCRLLRAVYPQLRDTLARALGGTTPPARAGRFNVYAMRVRAALHGHNAPLIANVDPRTGRVTSYSEWNPDGTGRSAVDAAWREPGHAVGRKKHRCCGTCTRICSRLQRRRARHDKRTMFGRSSWTRSTKAFCPAARWSS